MLNVENCKNIYDSFKEYTSTERLDGENKYHAEGFGLQDAIKGVRFRENLTILKKQNDNNNEIKNK